MSENTKDFIENMCEYLQDIQNKIRSKEICGVIIVRSSKTDAIYGIGGEFKITETIGSLEQVKHKLLKTE